MERNKMLKRFVLIVAVAFAFLAGTQFSLAGELMAGCCTRPACGKVCKLVCGTKKLTATCYGSECKDICIPSPSRQGCKHCATCCGKYECDAECPTTECCEVCGTPAGHCCPSCQPMPPKCEFCLYDWFACGCARPRTVKVLTKYQAEKEIPWYHWEVVDAACCECREADAPHASESSPRPRLFKPAPPDSQVGDSLELSQDEQHELAAWMADQLERQTPDVAPAAATVPVANKFAELFHIGDK